MNVHVALLRAVNVGGTGRLPMRELVAMCEDAGFADVRTYIASGNVVLRSSLDEAGVRHPRPAAPGICRQAGRRTGAFGQRDRRRGGTQSVSGCRRQPCGRPVPRRQPACRPA